MAETPIKDFERLADSLYIAKGRLISDKQSFDYQYSSFLKFNSKSRDPKIRQKTWINYQRKYSDNMRFNSLGGKGHDFRRDKQKTANIVVDDPKLYTKLGTQRSDLSGLDTKNGEKIQFKRVVYAKEENTEGKIFYRDRKGNYVSRE